MKRLVLIMMFVFSVMLSNVVFGDEQDPNVEEVAQYNPDYAYLNFDDGKNESSYQDGLNIIFIQGWDDANKRGDKIIWLNLETGESRVVLDVWEQPLTTIDLTFNRLLYHNGKVYAVSDYFLFEVDVKTLDVKFLTQYGYASAMWIDGDYLYWDTENRGISTFTRYRYKLPEEAEEE